MCPEQRSLGSASVRPNQCLNLVLFDGTPEAPNHPFFPIPREFVSPAWPCQRRSGSTTCVLRCVRGPDRGRHDSETFCCSHGQSQDKGLRAKWMGGWTSQVSGCLLSKGAEASHMTAPKGCLMSVLGDDMTVLGWRTHCYGNRCLGLFHRRSVTIWLSSSTMASFF